VEVDVCSADSSAAGSLRYFAAESCYYSGCPSLNRDLSDDLTAGSIGVGLDIVADGNLGFLGIVDNKGYFLSAAVGVDIGSSLGWSFDIGGVGVDIGSSLGWSFDIGGVGVDRLDSCFGNSLGKDGVVGLVGNKKVCRPNHHPSWLGRVGLQLEFHHQSAEMEGY